jgi:hypothetical protein
MSTLQPCSCFRLQTHQLRSLLVAANRKRSATSVVCERAFVSPPCLVGVIEPEPRAMIGHANYSPRSRPVAPQPVPPLGRHDTMPYLAKVDQQQVAVWLVLLEKARQQVAVICSAM